MPAGAYHLIADGVINAQPLVRFDVAWRHAGQDTPLATFTHQYPMGSSATYEQSASAGAFPSAQGDLLVLTITTLDGAPASSAEYIPNGEVTSATARDLTLDIP